MRTMLKGQLQKCVSLFERLHSHEVLRNISSSVFYRQRNQSQVIGAIENLYESILPFKNIEVKIDKEHTLGIFNDTSDTSFVLNVGYIDSSSSGEYTREQKVVVGLHGGSGNHNEMAIVLDYLACDDCRVIMPNFPGNQYAVGVKPHDTDNFKQSSTARGAFVQQFLKALKIPRVDMIVGHSGACYALTNFLAKPETDYIKSYAMISPGPHEVISFLRPHYDLIVGVDTLWKNPLSRRVLKLVVKLIIQTLGHRITVDESMLLMRILANWELTKESDQCDVTLVHGLLTCGHEDLIVKISNPAFAVKCVELNMLCVIQVPGQLEAIQKRQLPGLLFRSLNDVFLGNEIPLMKGYARLLGISDEDFTVYDKNEKLVEQSLTDTYSRVIIFQEGTHYPHLRHPRLIAEHLRILLDHVKHK